MAAGFLVTLAVGIPLVLLLDRDGRHPAHWDPRVAELADIVEHERGLDFEHPVTVQFLTAEQYTERTRIAEDELTTNQRENLEDQVGLLRALGVASGDLDLVDLANDLADAGTLAFYDPSAEEVVVRGTEMSVSLKVTLVHELTHVLQDQHFDLQRHFADEDGDQRDERREALTALVEGDAMRMERAYVERLSADEIDDYTSTYDRERAEAEDDLASVPAALVAGHNAPYVLGQPLVTLIAANGGNAAVDEAFGDPPTTGEHLFNPQAYFAGEATTELDEPPLPDSVAEEIDQGEMGAVSVYLILADRIDPLAALDASDGWGNSRYVSYQRDDRTCVRLALDGDADADDQELRQAFEDWRAAMPPEAGAIVTDLGQGRTLVESCDPGADVEASNDRALDVLTVPATRAQIAQLAAEGGAGRDDAWATGDCVVRELTLDQLLRASEASEVTPELREALTTAITTCRR